VLPLDQHGRYQVEDLFVLRMPPGERELVKARLEWTGTKIAFRHEVAVQAEILKLPSLEAMVTDK
jgi:hypothetical protein